MSREIDAYNLAKALFSQEKDTLLIHFWINQKYRILDILLEYPNAKPLNYLREYSGSNFHFFEFRWETEKQPVIWIRFQREFINQNCYYRFTVEHIVPNTNNHLIRTEYLAKEQPKLYLTFIEAFENLFFKEQLSAPEIKTK